jgi:hypothetical protein
MRQVYICTRMDVFVLLYYPSQLFILFRFGKKKNDSSFQNGVAVMLILVPLYACFRISVRVCRIEVENHMFGGNTCYVFSRHILS